MWIWVWWACGGGGDALPPAAERAALVEALRAAPVDPDGAFERCKDVREPTSNADCVTAVVQAAPRHPQAQAWCAGLPQVWQQQECAFVRAEFADDLQGCADAGPWADECRLHVWRGRVPRLVQDRGVQEAIEACRHGLVADGLDPEDPDLWHPVFWHLFDGGLSPDRCGDLVGAPATACRQVAGEKGL